MKALKMKSLKSTLFVIIIMLLIGGFMLSAGLPSVKSAAKGPVAWDSVDFSGDVEGTYVVGTIQGIYDWYCEETENGKTVAREYLIDADDYYYMGLRVMKSDMDAAENLLEASIAYLDGEDDGTSLTKAQYEVKGTITRIPDDSYELYQQYLDWDNMDAETRDMFLPYYLNVNKVGDTDMSGAIMFMVLAVIFLGMGLLFIIWIFTGKYQKSIKNYISRSSNPDAAREKVEYFLANTPEVKGLRYNRDFICGQENGTTAFGETSKLAWAYQLTTTHKRNFITVGKSYSLMLGFADGSRQAVSMKKEAIAQEHLQKLMELCPQAVFGYSEELDKMFRKDLPGFLNMKYNAAMNEAQQMNSMFDNM